ncbi:MAG: hypothetical protein KatS3mg034_0553 [Vicingaceae bacterium]|nr:MAG: hypothetical protein KatS3mg034_0553 [Vicingaceae bacterium]
MKSISKNNDPLIKNEVDNLFRKRFYEKILQRSKVLFIASMILYPAWAINDYIFARDLFYLFLGLRLLALVVMLVCFILMVKRKLHPYWATQIIFLLVVTEIAYMCAIVPEDSLIPYYIGFSTAFAAYYSVVIIPYSLSLLCYLYGAASFWFFIKIVGIHDELMYLKNGGLFFLTVSFFTMILAIFNYRSVLNEVKARILLDESYLIIENKNREIIDSINYAKRIQQTILPDRHTMESFFKKYFLIYLPRDIVSGDFYWMVQKENKIFLAVADCTGHGVPGSLLSMVCSNALKKVVIESGLNNPGEILTECNKIINTHFSTSPHYIKEGMDIGLCCWNQNENNLYFAGANIALYHFSATKQVLMEVKPDDLPIGFPGEIVFHTQKTVIGTDDTFYLFSDGYPDQFGGSKFKKLKHSRFIQLIENYATLPMQEQGNQLLNFFEEWKNSYDQIDDVTVLGFKIS